jgi:hypothetical protein
MPYRRSCWRRKTLAPTKAKDADVLMRRRPFDQFPDLWVTNPDFRELKRVSNGDTSAIQLGD